MLNIDASNIKTFADIVVLLKKEPINVEVVFSDIDLLLETPFSRGMKATIFAVEKAMDDCFCFYFSTAMFKEHNNAYLKPFKENEVKFFDSILNGKVESIYFSREDMVKDYILTLKVVKI
jgi:hypothetical protein